jgi:dethiobiotin synthetase
MNYFITGIGTNVGKTIVSAIITEALEADYWKPIQSGTIDGSDSEFVRSMITNSKTVIHAEAYRLKEPLSPHFAAKLENVEIELSKIKLPVRLSGPDSYRDETNTNLIIEGAGGLLVPLNSRNYVIDLARQLDAEIVLVISNYLGCINHTLLSIDYLLHHRFKIHSLVFNGTFQEEVKSAITAYVQGVRIIDIPELSPLSKESVSALSQKVKAAFLA